MRTQLRAQISKWSFCRNRDLKSRNQSKNSKWKMNSIKFKANTIKRDLIKMGGLKKVSMVRSEGKHRIGLFPRPVIQTILSQESSRTILLFPHRIKLTVWDILWTLRWLGTLSEVSVSKQGVSKLDSSRPVPINPVVSWGWERFPGIWKELFMINQLSQNLKRAKGSATLMV